MNALLTSLRTHLKGWFRFHGPRTEYASWEWLLMRLLFAMVLFYSFRQAGYHAFDWFDSPGRSGWKVTHPRGIAHFVSLDWVSSLTYVPWICGAIAVGLVLLVLGIFPLTSALLLLTCQTLVGTLENSASQNVFHTSQILGLTLLGMLIGAFGGKWAIFRENGWRGVVAWKSQFAAHLRNRSVYAILQCVAAAYVVAGISKLWRSKGEWVSQTANIPLQFVKNQQQDFYETLQASPAGNWAVEFVMDFPRLAKLCLGGGLALELLCVLALWNRHLAAVLGLGLVFMHAMISRVMSLNFDFNSAVLWIFLINPLWWLIQAVQGWRSRRKQSACPQN